MNKSVNEAVYRTYEAGTLSSATLLVDGIAAAEAVDIARAHPALGVGLHLDLDQFFGFGHNGFYGHSLSNIDAIRRETAERYQMDVIQASIRRQFEKFLGYGLMPSHVDGHHHVHLLPTVLPYVLETALAYGITAIRFFSGFYENNTELCEQMRDLLTEHHFRHTDDFRDFSNRYATLGLSAPQTEIMSHPAVETEGWRTIQFHRLMSPRLCRLLRSYRIELITYREIR